MLGVRHVSDLPRVKCRDLQVEDKPIVDLAFDIVLIVDYHNRG